MLSMATVLTNAWFAIRGSVITATNPATVFLFRDGAPDRAIVSLGVDSTLVNTASANYGDVVTHISVEIDDGRSTAFDYEMLLTPVFSDTSSELECPVNARCVRNGQFLAIEEPRRALDVPGGGSHSEYVGFNLFKGYCSVPDGCEGFDTIANVASRLTAREVLRLKFHFSLQSDGVRTSTCVVDLAELNKRRGTGWLERELVGRGWVNLRCQRSSG